MSTRVSLGAISASLVGSVSQLERSYAVLSEPDVLEPAVEYPNIKHEMKTRTQTPTPQQKVAYKNGLVQDALQSIAQRSREHTRSMTAARRKNLTRTDNELIYVVQFVQGCRAAGGIWESRKDKDLEFMCGVAVDVMKQIDYQFTEAMKKRSQMVKAVPVPLLSSLRSYLNHDGGPDLSSRIWTTRLTAGTGVLAIPQEALGSTSDGLSC